MPNENTSLKNVTPAGDSNTTHKMIIGKINTYRHPLLIVAGFLLVLLVWITATGKSGGQQLQPSANEIAEGAVALADHQVHTANVAIAIDIFDLGVVEGCMGTCAKYCIDCPKWCTPKHCN